MNSSEIKTEIEKSISKREVVIDKGNLPLNIVYKGRRYILLLTKNDRLILNKYED